LVPVLRTPRFRLEPISLAHVEGMIGLHADRETLRYIGGGEPYSPEATTRMVEGMAHYARADGFGWFAVLDRSTRVFLGAAAVQHLDLDRRKPLELAWRVLPQHRGQGVATEAARELARFAFEDLDREAVYAVAKPENTASLRVMDKLGMRFVGLERHWGEDLPTYILRR